MMSRRFIMATAIALAILPIANPKAAAAVASTYTADGLPTAQINGVGWDQEIGGNTVYVAGSFTKARPAGVAAGGSGEVTRNNGMAYDITTGAMTTFDPNLNAQAKAVAVSPDGLTVYYGGQFTSAAGQTHSKVAAYSTATGQIISSFNPVFSGSVASIVVSKDSQTIYVGGSFNTVNGSSRGNIAAVTKAGVLTTWAPRASSQVLSMVIAPGSTGRLAISGMFDAINGVPAKGIAFVSTSSGVASAFAATSVIKNVGPDGAISEITTDGTNIYASGWDFGASANFEGAFAADAATGAIKWMEDCHGDTYGNYASGGVLYTVGHAHTCQNVSGFPEVAPRVNHRAIAFTNAATTTVKTNAGTGYTNFGGQPGMTLISWVPEIALGTYTGQSQGAWTITGNGTYTVLAGEFPKVNGVAQQGLVRFPIRAIAPNKQGPSVLAAPTVSSNGTVTWKASWDRDDETLSYSVLRDSTVVNQSSKASNFWTLPTMTYRDITTGTHTYKIQASDGHGKTTTSPGTTVSFTAPAPTAAARVATTTTVPVDTTITTTTTTADQPTANGETMSTTTVTTEATP